MNTIAVWFNRFAHVPPPVIAIILSCLLVNILAIASFKLLNMRWLIKRTVFLIELTPLVSKVQRPIATKQLFCALHNLRAARTTTSRLLRHDIIMAVEIFGSQQSGVRYIVQADSRIANDLQHIFSSFLPDMQATILQDDCMLNDCTDIKTFKLTRHFRFPLAAQTSLRHHDVVAGISDLITKLRLNEMMTFQLVLKPTEVRQARAISNKLMRNVQASTALNSHGLPLFSWFNNTAASFMIGLIDIVSDVYFGQSRSSTHAALTSHRRPSQTTHMKRSTVSQRLTPHQEKIVDAMSTKINQPLFQAAIRLGVRANTRKEAKARIREVASVLVTHSMAPYQGLRAVHGIPFMNKYRQYLFSRRLPGQLSRNSCIVSASEVAGLYHFSTTDMTYVKIG